MKAKYKDRFGDILDLEIDALHDEYGRLDIGAYDEDGFLYCDVTVQLDGFENLPPDVAFVDDNNEPGLYKWLQEIGIAKPTMIVWQSERHVYTAFKFDLDKINEEEEE